MSKISPNFSKLCNLYREVFFEVSQALHHHSSGASALRAPLTARSFNGRERGILQDRFVASTKASYEHHRTGTYNRDRAMEATIEGAFFNPINQQINSMMLLESMATEYKQPLAYAAVIETNYKLEHQVEEITHNFPQFLPDAKGNEAMYRLLDFYRDRLMPRLQKLNSALERESGLSRQTLAEINAKVLADQTGDRITRIERNEWSPS